MQLINFIMLLLLPMTILANNGDGHQGGYYPGGYHPGGHHPGKGHYPHPSGKLPHGSSATGGYPHGAARPTGTGYPAGTGIPTRPIRHGPRPTGASPAKRDYAPYDSKPKYDHGHGHDEGKPRWSNFGKHGGSKPLYPVSSTGYVPQPTGGYFPTASSGYPVPTGRPSASGLYRRHPRMM